MSTRRFCTFCQHEFQGDLSGHLRCQNPKCGEVTYINPTPAVATILPVRSGNQIGALLGRRAIKDEQYGLWAAISGFLEKGDSFESGAAREVLEELRIELQLSLMKLSHSVTADDGSKTVVFVHYLQVLEESDIERIDPDPSEISAIKVVYTPVADLAWDSHTHAVNQFLQQAHLMFPWALPIR